MVKFKNRYVLIKVWPDETYYSNLSNFKLSDQNPENDAAEKIPWINTWTLQTTILDVLAALHGDFGYGVCKQSFAVKVYNAETEILILRICAEGCRFLLSALPFVTKLKIKIPGKSQLTVAPVCLQTLHFGGSMRSCEKSLLAYHKKQIIDTLKRCKNYTEKEACLKIYKQIRSKMKRRYDNSIL